MPAINTKPPVSAQNRAQATAGAVVNRQMSTMSGLLRESFAAYQSAFRDNLVSASEPMGMSPPNAQHYKGEDAFRHTYSSVRASQAFGTPVANLLGRGVEMLAAAVRENDTTLETARDIGMDLHNNRVGREIYRALPADATSEEIRDAVLAAGREGRLIVTPDDPRALKEYNAQSDMRGLSASNEMVVEGSRALAGSLKEGIHGVKNAVESGRQQLDQAATALDKSLKAYGDALKDALRQSGDSPIFTFSEKQLNDGETCARGLDPKVVATIAAAAGPGRETCMSGAEFRQFMSALSELTDVQRSSARDNEPAHQEQAERSAERQEQQGGREM
ncbi:hypothetical protein WDL1P1_00372 (plasmid) [Variovorax sp. WDL1]|nr:hypothetical protein CHC06_05945 [Variovorax sp. B2]PNG51195.1 hypothetical protein CHC07_05851 [Variovorax sp. B4]VTV17417.1 hypothetical protein WDL1P1_00372 [Variovorax sp. WDL1]